MMLNLAGPIIRPKSGEPKSILVLLHGYGSDGQDLIGLAPLFADILVAPLIFAPNAPESCPLNPSGYQWFPLGDASSMMRLDGIAQTAETVHVLLEGLWAETGLAPADTILAGFSQGGMLSLTAGLAEPEPLAGIISFSGGLPFEKDNWPKIASRPPVMLIHGDSDDVVPPMMSIGAGDALAAEGIRVEKHISPGVGHGIAPDGVEAARRFASAIMPAP